MQGEFGSTVTDEGLENESEDEYDDILFREIIRPHYFKSLEVGLRGQKDLSNPLIKRNNSLRVDQNVLIEKIEPLKLGISTEIDQIQAEIVAKYKKKRFKKVGLDRISEIEYVLGSESLRTKFNRSGLESVVDLMETISGNDGGDDDLDTS